MEVRNRQRPATRETCTGIPRHRNLKFKVSRQQALTSWIQAILESAKGQSDGTVERQLVGATLARRFKGIEVSTSPVHTGDCQTGREGDFAISKVVYHVTANPSLAVLQKCAVNIKAGVLPVLLVPREMESKARVLAEEANIERKLAIFSIENFVALNIAEMAIEDRRDCFIILKEIVRICNRRLTEVETDLSLQIHVS
jgi:hypothetical protein